MQVKLPSPIRILFLILLSSLSPSRAGFPFSPQFRAQLKRAVDSCRFSCSPMAPSNIKNPVTRQLVQDFGQMMRPILKGAGKAFGLGLVTHGVVVSGALINALYWAEGDELSRPDRASSLMTSKAGQSTETSAVLGAVLTMYSQGCVHKDSFSPDVTFEDPAGKCKGFGEVKEAFRALKAISPQTLDWELGDVTDKKVEIRLWQRYGIASRDVDLFEIVVVRHNKGTITSIEDRWKGKPLLQYPPFTWCRRLNGVVGDFLTSRLVPTDDQWDVKEEKDDHSTSSSRGDGPH